MALEGLNYEVLRGQKVESPLNKAVLNPPPPPHGLLCESGDTCGSLTRKTNLNGQIKYVGMEEGRGVHNVLVGKPEGKRPLGSPRRRWEDNIKMNLE